MRLSRLVQGVTGASIVGPDDIEVSEIHVDSREVTRGSLFVGLPGLETADSEVDRHVKQAIDRGAAAVAHQGGGIPGVGVIRLGDARFALGHLAANFFDRPAEHLQILAVTGTDGKTTTTYLLDQILESSGLTTGLLGTVEVKIGAQRCRNDSRMTTPDALEVQRLLARMVEQGVTHVSLEASSHALALHRLEGCHFASCGLTNITRDHVEFHGSWEDYFHAKASLFTRLGIGRPAILNRDDAHFERLSSLVRGEMLTYGFHPEAMLRVLEIAPSKSGSEATVLWHGGQAKLSVPIPGAYNVSNALAASALALSIGLSLEDVSAGLAASRPPPGRWQRVDAGQDFDVVVDYAHTINGFRSILSSLRERHPSPKRILAVFGATGDRDREKRPVLAEVARQYTDFFIITNEDPYSERAEDIVGEVAAGVPAREEGKRFEREVDRGRAIARAVQLAEPGDIVVILGKGHEESIVSGDERLPWSDLAAATEAVAGLA
ncbi:MAG: UDP-N-acetylmuramoyl-L-alanyl-D-glutamate--2,6-diaminopimelate ligase [Chloroflexota bacterium]